ncbi:MAG: hypothetical protein RLZZ385_66 [Pseudomonadota bacterium]|jgi:HlyD family secretion protein
MKPSHCLRLALLCSALSLAGCTEGEPRAVGQLHSDRLEITVESTEPIVAIAAMEGDALAVGQEILRQDDRRISLLIQESAAGVARLEALLTEQINGPREEDIDAAAAQLQDAERELTYRRNEWQRLQGLRERNLTSAESVDQANRLLEAAGAGRDIAAIRLRELQVGTREEVIEQTRQQLQQALAARERLEVDRQRLLITAPVTGVLDSLPFETGERPRMGDVVAVMLAGEQPHARIYVPESLRVQVAPGDTVELRVDGLAEPIRGTVRNIASDASFTPYFALTESDRGRLSYVAEIQLPSMPRRLPDGVPVEARFNGSGAGIDD